jgi:hypothetical protein
MYKKSSIRKSRGEVQRKHCVIKVIYHLRARNMIYSATEAELILLCTCSIERGMKQSPLSVWFICFERYYAFGFSDSGSGQVM